MYYSRLPGRGGLGPSQFPDFVAWPALLTRANPLIQVTGWGTPDFLKLQELMGGSL